jgi:hypothetical protein
VAGIFLIGESFRWPGRRRWLESGFLHGYTHAARAGQLRGWLAEVHRLTDPHREIIAYGRLQRLIDFFAAWTVLPWNADF